MSLKDRMTQEPDVLSKSENERLSLLQEIRKENANMGREEGRGARVLTTAIALVIIVWAALFLYGFATGNDFWAPTAVMLAMLVGMYWGMYRETRERQQLIFALVALVALIVCVVIFVGATMVK